MAKLSTYSAKGIKKSSIQMPKDMQEKVNMDLLAQAIRVYKDRMHPGLSKTKSRGMVSISKRKIYRQKGTGGARHGARSAPIFVGGGTTHGPKGIKRELKLPKNMRQKALRMALSLKADNENLFIIDGVSSLTKTKQVADLIAKISAKEKKVKSTSRFTFVLSEKNKDVRIAFRNLANSNIVAYKDLNALKVYLGGVLVIDKDALGEKIEPTKRNDEVKDKTDNKKRKAVTKRIAKNTKKETKK